MCVFVSYVSALCGTTCMHAKCVRDAVPPSPTSFPGYVSIHILCFVCVVSFSSSFWIVIRPHVHPITWGAYDSDLYVSHGTFFSPFFCFEFNAFRAWVEFRFVSIIWPVKCWIYLAKNKSMVYILSRTYMACTSLCYIWEGNNASFFTVNRCTTALFRTKLRRANLPRKYATNASAPGRV